MTNLAKLLGAISISTLLIVVISSVLIKPDEQKKIEEPQLQKNQAKKLSKFEEFLNPYISGSEINFGIYIKNLKTQEGFKLNEKKQFTAASLYKLWLMAVIYNKVFSGEFTEDESVEGDIASLNRKFGFSEEDAELKKGFLQYSVKSALEQMITISHNYAAMILLLKTSDSEINEYIKNLGLNNSKMGDPIQTTAEDIGLFFEKLYIGEIINAEYSAKMLEILKKQKINNRLPKYLPEGVVIAHKHGNLYEFENDAGIVFSLSGDYIIVLLTQSKAPLEGREQIAQISKAVFEYFNK